jgi:hypothetical protein
MKRKTAKSVLTPENCSERRQSSESQTTERRDPQSRSVWATRIANQSNLRKAKGSEKLQNEPRNKAGERVSIES